MSPASYRAAPPRVGRTRLHGRRTGPGGVRVTAPSHESQARASSPPGGPAPPRVRHVAEDGGSRAFAGPPQPVEIHHRGIWYSGELLGWRHEADGRVVARVRCVVDRLRHSAWKDLADLRLPDPANPPRSAVPAAVGHRRSGRGGRHAAARADGRPAQPPGEAGARPDAAAPPQRAAGAPALGTRGTGRRHHAARKVHDRPPRPAQGPRRHRLSATPATDLGKHGSPAPSGPGFRRCSGGRIRTCDLWVMSPASYRAAPPRVGKNSLPARGRREDAGPPRPPSASPRRCGRRGRRR